MTRDTIAAPPLAPGTGAAPKGNDRNSGYARDPHDWYCEPPFVVDQLFAHESFAGMLVYDPACGRGNILDRAQLHGCPTMGSDIVDRGAGRAHDWMQHDFEAADPTINEGHHKMAIVCNPPYGRLKPNMPRHDSFAERFIRRALGLGVAKVAMLVQRTLLWSERRWHLFHEDHPPTQLLFCSDRPSMPPGGELPRLIAEGRAFEGGAMDYLWLLWVRGAAPRPPAWLRPRGVAPANGCDLFQQGRMD